MRFTGYCAFSASINAYFMFTDIPGRRRRPLSQKLGLHLQLPIFLLQLAEPGPFRDCQRWFLVCMLNPVTIHPGPQCLSTNAELPCNISDRARTLKDHFDGLIFKFRRKALPPLRHVIPPFPERNPIGYHVRNLGGSLACLRG